MSSSKGEYPPISAAAAPRSSEGSRASLSIAERHLRAKLGDEAFSRLASARAEIFRGGLIGACLGACAGAAGFHLARGIGAGSGRIRLAPKYRTLAILSGASLGAFLGSGVASADARDSGLCEAVADGLAPESYSARQRAAARRIAESDANKGERLNAILQARAAQDAARARGDEMLQPAAHDGDKESPLPHPPRAKPAGWGWG